jgi:hypothetical protein
MGILSSRNVAMVATARRSGGWESIGGQFTCRDSGFVQQPDDEERIRGGAPDHVVRTVTENSRTLKLTSQGFEQE